MFSGSLRFLRIFKISIQDPQKDDDSHLPTECLGHITPALPPYFNYRIRTLTEAQKHISSTNELGLNGGGVWKKGVKEAAHHDAGRREVERHCEMAWSKGRVFWCVCLKTPKIEGENFRWTQLGGLMV